MFCIWVTPADAVGETSSLCGDQLRNADQVVGDQIEHEVSSDACDAAMFGLAHGAMLLAPAEDAFDHRPARLRHSIAVVPCGAPIDGALASKAALQARADARAAEAFCIFAVGLTPRLPPS